MELVELFPICSHNDVSEHGDESPEGVVDESSSLVSLESRLETTSLAEIEHSIHHPRHAAWCSTPDTEKWGLGSRTSYLSPSQLP